MITERIASWLLGATLGFGWGYFMWRILDKKIRGGDKP